MPDETKSPQTQTAPLTERQKAIAAWHDADTDEKKKAAVKQFPVLTEMYSAAQNYK